MQRRPYSGLHTPSTEILDVYVKANGKYLRWLWYYVNVLTEQVDITVDHVFTQKFSSNAQLPCTKMEDSNTYNGSTKHLCNRQGIVDAQKRDCEGDYSCGGIFVVYMCTTSFNVLHLLIYTCWLCVNIYCRSLLGYDLYNGFHIQFTTFWLLPPTRYWGEGRRADGGSRTSRPPRTLRFPQGGHLET